MSKQISEEAVEQGNIQIRKQVSKQAGHQASKKAIEHGSMEAGM